MQPRVHDRRPEGGVVHLENPTWQILCSIKDLGLLAERNYVTSSHHHQLIHGNPFLTSTCSALWNNSSAGSVITLPPKVTASAKTVVDISAYWKSVQTHLYVYCPCICVGFFCALNRKGKSSMNQRKLNQEVAFKTGETISEIARRGFSLDRWMRCAGFCGHSKCLN